MTGRRFYVATLNGWRRHAASFVHSHWIVLKHGPAEPEKILVQVDAEEGGHVALEDDPDFEALPYALTQRSISVEAHADLAELVGAGATTFEVAEAAARIHPLLRHRVF